MSGNSWMAFCHAISFLWLNSNIFFIQDNKSLPELKGYLLLATCFLLPCHKAKMSAFLGKHGI